MIIKNSTKTGLFEALDVAGIWIDRYIKKLVRFTRFYRHVWVIKSIRKVKDIDIGGSMKV